MSISNYNAIYAIPINMQWTEKYLEGFHVSITDNIEKLRLTKPIGLF